MRIIEGKEVSNVGQIEANTLVHDDCLHAMQFIPAGSVDMILADLPYG